MPKEIFVVGLIFLAINPPLGFLFLVICLVAYSMGPWTWSSWLSDIATKESCSSSLFSSSSPVIFAGSTTSSDPYSGGNTDTWSGQAKLFASDNGGNNYGTASDNGSNNYGTASDNGGGYDGNWKD